MDSVPTLANLSELKAPNGQSINIITKMAPNWRDLATSMNFDNDGTQLRIIEGKYPGDPVECCRAMFQHWLHGNGEQPCTWRKLIELINKGPNRVLAQEIQCVFSH